MTTSISDPREKVHEALQQVRLQRHHRDCRCFTYKTFCSEDEYRWSRMLDALIDRAR